MSLPIMETLVMTSGPLPMSVAPFTAGLRPIAGRPTAFVCVNHACRLPVTEPEAFAVQLDDEARSGAPKQARESS